MDSIYYKGNCNLVDANEEDAVLFASNIRKRELREMELLFGVYDPFEAVRNSIKSSMFSYVFKAPDGEPLILLGVADIKMNRDVSRHLGILDGKGGNVWMLSVPAATRYKMEFTKYAAPLAFMLLQSGYDFLTAWYWSGVSTLPKLISRFGFRPVERSVVNGEVFIRAEWRRNNG
ncbi:MAG: hypothetical protein RRY12_10765 [Cloacibacillus sp.]